MSATILFNQSQKNILQIQTFIQEFKQSNSDTSLSARISAALEHLTRSVSDLENFSKREVTQLKREIGISRANKIKAELQELTQEFTNLKKIARDRLLEHERTDLLGQGARQRDVLKERETQDTTVLMMDMLGKESMVLDSSEARIEEFINVGQTALNDLYEQRSMLKNTQRRLLDAANTMGLSSTVIRFIEQRSATDRYLLWGGIIGSVIFMVWFASSFG